MIIRQNSGVKELPLQLAQRKCLIEDFSVAAGFNRICLGLSVCHVFVICNRIKHSRNNKAELHVGLAAMANRIPKCT